MANATYQGKSNNKYSLNYISQRIKNIEEESKHHGNTNVTSSGTVSFKYETNKKATHKASVAIKNFYRKHKS